MPADILEIEHLSKRYPNLLALDDVSLTIKEGEIFALLGPNGAGKTTLIGAICGLVKKSSGTLRLFGTDLDRDPIAPRYRVGLVPQEINFDPFFTVAEALYIQQGYYGQPRNEARVREVLEALKLSDKANSQTRTLSGGMKRRLLIGKALVHEPKLVFLDEPTAGVDVELRRDLWSYVRRLRDRGTTIVLTTHYLEEAEELADRVGIINKGKLLLLEEKNALLQRLGEKRVEVTLTQPVVTLPPQLTALGATLDESGRTLSWSEKAGSPPTSELLAQLFAERLSFSNVETRRSRLEDILIEVLNAPEKNASGKDVGPHASLSTDARGSGPRDSETLPVREGKS